MMETQPFLRNNSEMEAAKQIVDIMSRLDMTPKQKIELLNKTYIEAKKEGDRLEAERDLIKAKVEALTSLAAWILIRPITIEKNDCSRLHLLRQAAIDEGVFGVGHSSPDIAAIIASSNLLKTIINSFVVKHDWSSALGGFEDSSEILFPYPHCCFEFRINGKTLIVVALQLDGKHSLAPFIECNGSWLYLDMNEDSSSVLKYAWDQIKAICIALDAEIATHHVERASINLNKKREVKGRVPLNDYHVVNLAKRHRIANVLPTQGEHGHKRLHFRRGHWRHYETSKTWVKWCLVGNPDLGFINKSYSL